MNCDAIAPHYQWMEFAVFGRKLEKSRFHFLSGLANSRRALVVGDGDGRFLHRLLTTCPRIETDYVDSSAKMLALARQRAGTDRVTYYCADVLTDPLPPGPYDVVAAHFFFDCFEHSDLELVIDRLAEASLSACWLVTEFRMPEGWLALPSRLLLWAMYEFFGIATRLQTRRLVDHRPYLEGAGFQMKSEEKYAGGLIVSELWAPQP